jgi:hypothetical protein
VQLDTQPLCSCLSLSQDWATPLGTVSCNTAAVDYLTHNFSLPVDEAPHATEHSIENQLPFLQHGALVNWDLAAAGCSSSGVGQPGAAAAAAVATTAAAAAAAAAGATLSIVPISIGYLGNQLHTIISLGAAVRSLLQHLRQQQQQQSAAGASSSSSSEVMLIVTSDLTHAGPWYRELPPAGVSLEEYMRSKDTPVLQVGLGVNSIGLCPPPGEGGKGALGSGGGRGNSGWGALDCLPGRGVAAF